MPAAPLSVSTPAAQGLDADGVHAFLDRVEGTGIELHGLAVVRHDRLVAAGVRAPYEWDRPRLLYSLSKSFTGTAAGLAAGDGLLGLDDTVLSYFPELDGAVTDPRSRAMTVRHVASMASGHEEETVERAHALSPDDLLRGFLLLPPERDPGSVFAYNQPATFALAAVVQRVTGRSLTGYLRARLLDPLGIGPVGWQRGPDGLEIGYSGLFATVEDVARLGLLYLRGGVWGGRRLLPASWVREATRVQTPNARDGQAARSDWQQGYGLQFWRSRHGYRGDGAYGQFCLVLPEQDAVVALTGGTERMQEVLDAVWEELLPAFAPGPLDGSGDAGLARRLERLRLDPVAGAPAPPPEAADAWRDASFTPRGGGCGAQPGLTGVRVAAAGGGGEVTLTERGRPLRLRLAAEPGWAVDTEGPVPVAVSGGWSGPGALGLQVAFLDTPHRLALTCTLADRACTADWLTRPLGAPLLTELCRPVS
ncbi:serine hydrolase domain-containing protein [Streptomyces sp. NPDC050560]|uniref:serine hydrolase domain-containing protein n=1 Tax=Streptomyces sp. NPDC050560 TaxID=3365630 RepID=UPI0037915C32